MCRSRFEECQPTDFQQKPTRHGPPGHKPATTFNIRTKAQSSWQIWSVIMEVLDMTQRGNHCRLVWSWIRPRCKLRWKHVKRWWEGCPGEVSRNCNVGEILKICRWAFVRILTSVLWAHGRPVSFCPHTRPDIPKGNDWPVFSLAKNPTFVCLCWWLSLFFLAHFLSDICQGVHD